MSIDHSSYVTEIIHQPENNWNKAIWATKNTPFSHLMKY